MVKIFIGNIASDTSPQVLCELFEKYGEVSHCDILKSYGFVDMDSVSEAEELHVSNLSDDITQEVLKAKFEEFGPVAECDNVKEYAFVHMEQVEDAMNAISMMDNTAFKSEPLWRPILIYIFCGNIMIFKYGHCSGNGKWVTLSHFVTGNHTGCFVSGKHGHWSKDCLASQNDRGSMMRARSDCGFQRGHPGFGICSPPMSEYMGGSMYYWSSYSGSMPPLRPRGPAVSEHSDTLGSRPVERSSADGHGRLYSSSFYYEKYRGQPYGSSCFVDRCTSYIPPPPRPPPAVS
ncbi:RNA-binding protein 4.1-like [Synchiropus picturatus]